MKFTQTRTVEINITSEMIAWLNENFLVYDGEEFPTTNVEEFTERDKETLLYVCDELYGEIDNEFPNQTLITTKINLD